MTWKESVEFLLIAAISSASENLGASEDSMDFSCLFRVKVICVYNKAHNIALICFQIGVHQRIKTMMLIRVPAQS